MGETHRREALALERERAQDHPIAASDITQRPWRSRRFRSNCLRIDQPLTLFCGFDPAIQWIPTSRSLRRRVSRPIPSRRAAPFYSCPFLQGAGQKHSVYLEVRFGITIAFDGGQAPADERLEALGSAADECDDVTGTGMVPRGGGKEWGAASCRGIGVSPA